MASAAHGRWGLLSHDSRNSQSKEFARSDPPSPLLSSEESESLSLAAARCWAMIILGAFFKCSLSSSLDHNKKCNNPLHQKQLDGKANIISPPRGGRGRKRKGEGPFLPTFPTLSPRGLNTQATTSSLWLLCRLTTKWGTQYHCLSLLTILKGQAWPACIASVSVRLRSKERGTRVKWRK